MFFISNGVMCVFFRYTICPRSLDQIYISTYWRQWAKTSWTDSSGAQSDAEMFWKESCDLKRNIWQSCLVREWSSVILALLSMMMPGWRSSRSTLPQGRIQKVCHEGLSDFQVRGTSPSYSFVPFFTFLLSKSFLVVFLILLNKKKWVFPFHKILRPPVVSLSWP